VWPCALHPRQLPFFAERDSCVGKYRIVREMTRLVPKRTDDRRSYPGSCHCGRVRFKVQAPRITAALECNCSYCRRVGALWLCVAQKDLKVLAGGEHLALYQFGTRTAQHYFCRHCGIAPFSRPRLDPKRWAANLRCLEELDLSALTLRRFDGENWEKAAKALQEKAPK
jgi:hypothetical protein